MKLLTIWINMLIVIISVLAIVGLSALDIQLLQWKLATIAALGMLFLFQHEKPCPQGKVRVQRFHRLNSC